MTEAKERPKPRNDYLDCYTGPKVKWEERKKDFLTLWNLKSQDTGLYKALVKSQDIEEELTKIRNLIRKRRSKSSQASLRGSLR